MYLGGQGRSEEVLFELNSSGQPTKIWGKTVLGRGNSKCKVVTSGRSVVFLKTERQ